MKLFIEENSNYLTSAVPGLIYELIPFRDEFQKQFNEVYADIETFKNNPNCSCKFKIKQFILENKSLVYSFLVNYFNNNPSLQDTVNNTLQRHSVLEVAGQTFTIDDTEEAFSAFYQKILSEKFIFQTFSLLKDNNKLRIFFL
jgi:hypothetical protein